jgi:hypothetical protein
MRKLRKIDCVALAFVVLAGVLMGALFASLRGVTAEQAAAWCKPGMTATITRLHPPAISGIASRSADKP